MVLMREFKKQINGTNKQYGNRTTNRNRVSALRENNRVGGSGRNSKRGQRDWPALGALERKVDVKSLSRV